MHGSGVLAPDVLRGDLDIKHRGVDVSVSHEVLEGREGDSGAHHLGSKGVPEPMRIGVADLAARPMMAGNSERGPAAVMAWPRWRPFKETNQAGELVRGLSRRK